MPYKPKTKREYQEIGEYKEYIWDFPIVAVETVFNRESYEAPLEIIGTSQGIFINPAMKNEPADEKYKTFNEPEEVFLVRDSYPENQDDDYWEEGVDEIHIKYVDIVVDQLVNNL